MQKNSTIISDDYRSYVPALKKYLHQPTAYKTDSESLGWLHTMVGNAKAFILGTYHGLPEKNLDAYLEEFCFRFSRRSFKESLFDRLAIALTASTFTELKG